MQTAERSSIEIPSGNSTPLPEKKPIISQEDKIASISTESEVKRPAKILPLIPAQELKQGAAIHEEMTAGLHAGFYREQAVTLLSLSSSVWEKSQESVHAFYGVTSPFWLLVVGVSEEEKSRTVAMAELPKTRFPEWLSSTAADAWSARCRLMRDVAVGLYQCRTSGATHIAWNLQQLYLDAQGRAQLLPGFSETAVADADDVFALGQLLWCMVSRSTTPADGWEQGKGLPQHCSPEVIALIRACTDSTESARPSLKTLAKGLDILWQRAEQGFSEVPPSLTQGLSPLQKDQKYEDPSPMNLSATITPTQLSQVHSSGSLNLLLVDDQTVSWLSAADPRYQVGVKLCALRDSLAQPVESKASLPALQQEIQRTLESKIEMMLWLGEEGEDPSHSFQETAWWLWQAPHWQAYRPGDPPPSAWLPLFINLHQPSINSPLFTRTHQLPDEVAAFTDSEWQILHSHYALFWLVQGMGQLTEPCNLYEVNALHRGGTRLLLHSQKSDAFKWEESTYFMPHSAEGQLLSARYARYTTDPDCDFNAWEGRYQGKIGPETQETTPTPIALTPAKDLALNRNQLTLPDADEKNTLGKGAFGEVLRGSYYGQPVAVKRFKEAKLSASDQAQLKDEAAVMVNLQSPFLIRLLGLSLDTPPLLVMELAEGGSLYHKLKDASQELPWVWRLRVLRDIALGLSVLHAHELLHRDLKSLNILLDITGRAKLCDFGLSTLKSQAKDTADVGTLLWNAPEVLAGKAATPSSDIYSLAIICWEVVARRLPYKDPTTGKLKEGFEKRVQAGERETIPSDCPPELAMVIQACWTPDPAQRPTAGQVAQVLEDLWQKAVKAEQFQPALKRQTSSLMPSISLENKRTKPLTPNEVKADAQLSSNNERKVFVSDSPSKPTGDWSGLSSEMLASLMLELAKQSVAPVEKKINQSERGQISSSKTAINENKSPVISHTSPSSSSSTSPVDLPLSGLSPEALQSLMPDLLKQGASVSGESPSSRPTEQDQKPLTPTSSTTPSQTAVVEFKTLLARSQQQPPCWQDKQSPEYTLGVKLHHLREKVLADPYITQELSCYIAPNGQAQAGTGLPSDPLYPWVEREFLQGSVHVLLLQGLAGAGKSTFNRHLLRTLWQDPAWQSYRPSDPAPRAPIPLFIPLQSTQVNPRDLWDYYPHLPEISFTSAEIRLLQSDYHTIWIADGYDEIPGQSAPNLYDANHLGDTQGRVKLIIGCRSQRVQALVEDDSFVPHTDTIKPDRLRYRTRYVSPFTPQQTQDYIEKYVAQHQNDRERPKDWNAARYQVEFKAIPELQTLIDTPFMLWMTLSILPELAKEQSKEKIKVKDKADEKEVKETKESKSVTSRPAQITRAALYDRFMESWFTRQAKKAWQAKTFLKDPASILGKRAMQTLKTQTGSDDVQVVWLKAAYRAFCLSFAQQLTQAGQISAQDNPVEEKETTVNWQRALLGEGLTDSGLLRQGCPLRESADHAWGFIHASLLDYFMTTAVAEQLVLSPGVTTPATHPLFTRNAVQAVALLACRHVTLDQARFLADRVRANPDLKAALWALVERSKTEPAVAIASANAITVFNRARYVFGGLNLAGIRIPGADLTGSYWDQVNLSHADLSDANLRFVWMNDCLLSGATLRGVQFGEFPSVAAQGQVTAMMMHPREPNLMAIAAGVDIMIYDRAACSVIHTLAGHTDEVTCLSYAPDGSQLASGSRDKMVRLWDPCGKQPAQVLAGHEHWVTCLTYAPDGSQLASGGGYEDNTVRLWDPRGEQLARVLAGHAGDVNCLSYAPDGSQLASGSNDRTVRLWDPRGEQPARVLARHTDYVNCLTYAPDGSQLASGSMDKTVRLWDPRGDQPAQVLVGHTEIVWCLSYSPDGSQLASGSLDGTLRLWNPRGEQPAQVLAGHKGEVLCLTYAPDGSQLASGSYQEVWLWDPRGDQPAQVLAGHTNRVQCLSYALDGSQLASGSSDKTVRLWDLRGDQPAQVLVGHTREVTCLSTTPDDSQLASGSKDGTVWLWDPRGEQPVQVLAGYTSIVWCLSYAPDGSQLASGDQDGTVRLWDLRGDQPAQVLRGGHTEAVTCLSYAPDGSQLASGDQDGTVRLWDPHGDQPAQVLVGHICWVKCLSYVPDGSQLASGSEDRTVRLWDPRGDQPAQVLAEHTGSVKCLSYAPDGSQLVSGDSDGMVWLWDPRGEQPAQVLAGHRDRVTCLSYALDGSQLASGSEDKTVRLWDPRGEQPVQVLEGHTSSVNCLTYAPDGSQLASGSEDRTVRLWDTRTGACLQVWHAPALVTQLLWRNDTLFIGCDNGIVAALRRHLSWQSDVPDRWALAWLQCGNLPVLGFKGCDLTDVQGLQPFQRTLIEQRGGKNLPPPMAETKQSLPKTKALALSDSSHKDLAETGEAKEMKFEGTPSRSIFAGLLRRRSRYSNSELLAQADQLMAGITHPGTKQRYLAKLAYYRKHIHTLNKNERQELKNLLHTLRQIASQFTPTKSRLTPPEQKSKFSFGFLKSHKSQPKPLPAPITSTSSSCSSSSSSSTMSSTISTSQSGRLFVPTSRQQASSSSFSLSAPVTHTSSTMASVSSTITGLTTPSGPGLMTPPRTTPSTTPVVNLSSSSHNKTNSGGGGI